MYHAGWAWAGGAPYKGTKLFASHFGGTRNPMAIRWPAHQARLDTRTQFHHVNESRRPVRNPRDHSAAHRQWHSAGPIDGVSFAYTFNDANAKGRNALSTSKSWVAAASITTAGWRSGPRSAHSLGPRRAERHPAMDAGQGPVGALQPRGGLVPGHDLADKMPQKLADMKDVFLIEFAKNHGFPDWRRALDSRLPSSVAEVDTVHSMGASRRNHAHAGVIRTGDRQQAECGDDQRRNSRKRQRRAVRARRFQRRSESLREGRHALIRVQPVRVNATHIRAKERLSPGKAKIEVETSYVEPKPAGPLKVVIRVDGKEIGSGRCARRRTALVHGQRLPGYRHRPRITGLGRLLRPSTVQVQRQDRQRPREVHQIALSR